GSLLAGCAGAAASRPPATPAGGDSAPAPVNEAEAAPTMAMKSGAAPAAAPPGMSPISTSATTTATSTGAGARGAAAVKPARPEMLDIEANLQIEVESVASAAAALRALTKRFDGVITEDQLNQAPHGATAQMTIRVPSAQVDAFFEAVGTVG